MMAALTAALGVSPSVKTPWFCIMTADMTFQDAHDLFAYLFAADEREAAAGNRAAELVRQRGQKAGNRSPDSRPRRSVGAVGVHHTADV